MFTTEMLNYVKQQLIQNIPKENIKNALVGQGWSEADVNEAFAQIESGNKIPATNLEVNNISNHSTVWIAAVIMLLILSVAGWYAYGHFFNKLNETRNAEIVVEKSSNEQSVTENLSPLLEQIPYVNNAADFQINFPKGWEIEPESPESKFKIIVYANKQNPDPDATMSIDVKLGNYNKYFDMDAYIQEIEKLKKEKEFSGMNFLSKKTLTLNNGEKFSYQFSFSDVVDEDEIIITQAVISYSDKIYFIHFSCLSSQWDSYYEDLFESSLKTFKLLSNDAQLNTQPDLPIIDSRLEQKTYLDKTNGYKVNFPKDWEVKYIEKPDLVGFQSSPKDVKIYNGQPIPGFALLITPTYGQNLNEILDFIVKNESSQHTVNKKKFLKVNSYDAISFEGVVEEKGIKFKAKFILVIKGARAYLIGGIALADTWKEYEDLFSASLATFNLID